MIVFEIYLLCMSRFLASLYTQVKNRKIGCTTGKWVILNYLITFKICDNPGKAKRHYKLKFILSESALILYILTNDSTFWISILCGIVSLALDHPFEKQSVNIIHVPYVSTSLIHGYVFHGLTNSFYLRQSLLFHVVVKTKILVRNICPFEINCNFILFNRLKFTSNIHKWAVFDILDWTMRNKGWSLFLVLVLFNYNTLAYPNFNFYRSFYEKFAPHDEKVSTLISTIYQNLKSKFFYDTDLIDINFHLDCTWRWKYWFWNWGHQRRE